MSEVTIKYSKPDGAFYAGEFLSGWILVDNVNKDLKFDKIELHITGKATVCWTESSGTGDDASSTTYSDSEQLLDASLDLRRTGEALPGVQGKWQYSFSYNLPSNLPCSFKIFAGKIEYSCTASFVGSKVPKTLFGSRKKWKEPFMILPHLNLILNPNRNVTASKADNKKLKTCCCCCPIPIGRVSAGVSIDKGAFYLGEMITCNVEIHNATGRNLKFVQIGIRKELICRVKKSSSVETKLIVKVKHPEPIPPYESCTFKNVQLSVHPSHLPTNLGGGCKIIELNYTVEVNIAPTESCCCPKCDTLVLTVPIVIGCRKITDDVINHDTSNGRNAFSHWSSVEVITTQPHGYECIK